MQNEIPKNIIVSPQRWNKLTIKTIYIMKELTDFIERTIELAEGSRELINNRLKKNEVLKLNECEDLELRLYTLVNVQKDLLNEINKK